MTSDPEATTLWIINSIFQVCAASASCIASSIIVAIVARSKTQRRAGSGRRRRMNNNRTGGISSSENSALLLKSSPYHRIIFGISLSDMLNSFAMLSGPFLSQRNTRQAFWAVGNDITCKANGILFIMGYMGSPLYMFFLCYYYFFKVKWNETDDAFSVRIEWKLHGLISAFIIAICIACLATNVLNTNSDGKFCSVTVSPTGCRQRPDLYGECDESIARHALFLSMVTLFATTFICLVGIIVCMGRICWYVIITTRATVGNGATSSSASPSQTLFVAGLKRMRKLCFCRRMLFPPHSATASGDLVNQNDVEANVILTMPTNSHRCIDRLDLNSRGDNDNMISAEENVSIEVIGRPRHVDASSNVEPIPNRDLILRYRREFMVQGSLYVLVFLITNSFVWTFQIIYKFMEKDSGAVLLSLASFLYPLGGILNILVYSRPKVLSLLRTNPNMSWFGAFILVVKAGAMVPVVVVVEDDGDRAVQQEEVTRTREVDVPDEVFGLSRDEAQSDLSGSTRQSAYDVGSFPSSIITPPVSLGNILSAGDESTEDIAPAAPKEDGPTGRRRFYSLPPPLSSRIFIEEGSHPGPISPDQRHGTDSRRISSSLASLSRRSEEVETSGQFSNDSYYSSFILSSGIVTIMEEDKNEE